MEAKGCKATAAGPTADEQEGTHESEAKPDRRGRGGRVAVAVKKAFPVDCRQRRGVTVAYSHEWQTNKLRGPQ